MDLAASPALWEHAIALASTQRLQGSVWGSSPKEDELAGWTVPKSSPGAATQVTRSDASHSTGDTAFGAGQPR